MTFTEWPWGDGQTMLMGEEDWGSRSALELPNSDVDSRKAHYHSTLGHTEIR